MRVLFGFDGIILLPRSFSAFFLEVTKKLPVFAVTKPVDYENISIAPLAGAHYV